MRPGQPESAAVTAPDEHSTPVELAATLDELLDEISEVKQAGWLSGGHPVHAAFTDLLSFLGTSVRAVVLHEDEAGGRPLSILTPSGRVAKKIAGHEPEDLVATVDHHLAVLAESISRHASAVANSDPSSATLLDGIAEGLEQHQQSIRAALGRPEES